MPLFEPVTISPPPPRSVTALAPTYWRKARDIARHDGGSVLGVLARILYGRVRYGFGAELYDTYRFNRKPLASFTDYLPMKERDVLFNRVNPPEARVISENKAIFFEQCQTHSLTTPRVLALILKSAEITHPAPSIPAVTSGEELEHLLQDIPDGKYVLKPIDSGHGWGVSLVTITRGAVYDSSGSAHSAADIVAECSQQQYTRRGFLLQEYLISHSDLLDIIPGPGLGSFRVNTFLFPDSTVRIYYAELKVPGEGRITSNFSGGEGGSFLCRIDLERGVIAEAIGATRQVPITTSIATHPVTGAVLRGKPIPFWKELVELVRQGCRVFSGLKTIGWDVAITDTGPTLLEANWAWGHDSIEITFNRGIRAEFRELVEACSGQSS